MLLDLEVYYNYVVGFVLKLCEKIIQVGLLYRGYILSNFMANVLNGYYIEIKKDICPVIGHT